MSADDGDAGDGGSVGDPTAAAAGAGAGVVTVESVASGESEGTQVL